MNFLYFITKNIVSFLNTLTVWSFNVRKYSKIILIHNICYYFFSIKQIIIMNLYKHWRVKLSQYWPISRHLRINNKKHFLSVETKSIFSNYFFLNEWSENLQKHFETVKYIQISCKWLNETNNLILLFPLWYVSNNFIFNIHSRYSNRKKKNVLEIMWLMFKSKWI